MMHPSLAAFDLLDVLQLIRSENVGPVTFFQLIKRFGSPQEAMQALPQLAARGGMRRKPTLASRQAVEKEYELSERFGAQFLLYGAADYPALLTHIPDAPPLLMLRGSSAFWEGCPPDPSTVKNARTERPREPSAREAATHCASSRRVQEPIKIAIVGSRNASAAGCGLTRKLAKQCGEMGISVISGLARGIDTAAHHGALQSGSVGVIAGGIDNIYPPENARLYEKLASEGAILSENPFGSKPQARSFPSRNRIIAGMADGLLVVEAAPRSGSLITARFALDYDREVMAIPGSPLDPRSAGTNGLIKQGARLIENVDDIRDTLLQQRAWPQRSQVAEPAMNDYAHEEGAAIQPDEATLREIREAIESRLSTAPIQLDDLARELKSPVSALQSALLELELAGRLARHAGGKVSLIYQTESATAQANLL